jgi:hypothetical protein
VAGAAAIRPGARLRVVVDLAAPSSLADGAISIDEFGLIAAAMLDALGRARPLRAADLVLPTVDVSASGFDAAELTTRAGDVEEALRRLIADLRRSTTGRVSALVRCASIGIHRAVRAIEAGATEASVAPIIAALEERLTATIEPSVDPIETALSRLRLLTGGLLPILPLFTPAPDPDRVAAARVAQRRQQVADAGHMWLRQYARVRADLGATVEFLLLAESASERPIEAYGLAQLPHTGGEWAAVSRPPDDGDRLSIVSLTGPDALGIDSGPLAGLVVDSWTEGIPRPQQQTGVAVHFDTPTARPPQTILLSVVDDEREFSADELADQLLHTIELAKLRAVGPGGLGLVGQYLPTVFLPGDAVVSGGET